MHDWFLTPLGSYIRHWEETHFQSMTVDIFGFHAVQLGFPEIGALDESRMPYRWLTGSHCEESTVNPASLTKSTPPVNIAVIHNFRELPFASQSVDLVVLPHVLEFSEYPHQILREVERILIPEGHVIISGFNPASLWGLRQAFGNLTGSHFLPQAAEFFSLHRIKDWLKLLNLETNRGHFGCYLPPCKTVAWQKRFAFMEKSGDRWWPYCGAVYIVQAIKRVHGMHLIGPAFRKKLKPSFRNVVVNNKTSAKTN